MGKFFNMDNKFFVFMSRVADMFILNMVFIICCIPIVTIGASLTALNYVTLKMARNEEAYIVRSFFKSFKENFRQATIIHIIMLAVGILLYLDVMIVGASDNGLGKVLFCFFIAFTILFAMVYLYIYPVLARFYNTVKNTFVNSFLMAIRHLPYTVLMFLITICPVAIVFIPDVRLQSTILMLFFLMGFALVAYVNSRFMVKVFDNYMPAEETTAENALPDQEKAV